MRTVARVFGCAPLATLALDGTGATPRVICTSFQTGAVTPALLIETRVTTRNDRLPRQVDELAARVARGRAESGTEEHRARLDAGIRDEVARATLGAAA